LVFLALSNERQKTPTLVCYRSYDVRGGLEELEERAKTVGSIFATTIFAMTIRLSLCFKFRNFWPWWDAVALATVERAHGGEIRRDTGAWISV
jgi:hypothetical protein